MAKMGGARTFFTVYASIKSEQILDDANALGAVLTAVFTDAIEGMMIAFEEVFMGIEQWNDALFGLQEPIEMAKIHFEKFFDDVGPEVIQLEQDIMKIGAAYNQSAAESLEAAATMAQLGSVIGGQPAQGAAREGAMLLGAVGMMETEAAMSALTQLQLQTGYMYDGLTRAQRELLTEEEQRAIVMSNTIGLVDKLNEVENNSGATIQNLIGAMNQYASAATIVNTTLDEQIALGATLIEQGEQSSKAGRGIKQMLARLASDRSGNNALLAEYNVQVKDADGNMFTLMDVMTQLKPKWDELNSSQQTNIAIGVAGAHHYVRFIKLMEGYDRAVEIQEASLSSLGSAYEEYAIFQNNAAYQTQLYEKEIDLLQSSIAEKLLPAQLRAAQTQYMLIANQEKIFNSKYMGGLLLAGNTWMMIGSTVFATMKGLIAFGLALAGIGVAQKTLLAQMVARTNAQKVNNVYANAEMGTQLKLVEGTRLLNHLKNAGLTASLTETELNQLALFALEHKGAVELYNTNLKVAQVKLEQTYAQSVMDGVLAERLKGSVMNKNWHITSQVVGLQQMGVRLAGLSVKQLNSEIRAQTVKLNAQRTIIMAKENELIMNSALTESERALLNLETTRLRNEYNIGQAGLNVKRARLNFMDNEIVKQHLLNRTTEQYLQTTTTTQRAEVNELYLKMILAAQDDETLLTKIKLIDVKLFEMQVNQAVAAGQITEIQGRKLLGLALKKEMFTRTSLMKITMMTTNSLMLASMAMMLLGNNTDAMEASAILMTLAFVPMIGMTMQATAQMTKLAGATAYASGGLTILFATIAAAAAYGLSKHFDFFGDAGSDMDDMMEQLEADTAEAERLYKQFALEQENYMSGEMGMMDDWTSSIDDMTDSMQEFDDKRLEIFFGGRRSAMDGAMFKELKQNGVENLYFAPEVFVTNNFNGVTYAEAADLVSDSIEERLKATGVLQ